MHELFPLQHWFATHLGIGTSPRAVFWYSWWSGAGSDMGELTLVAGMLALYKAHLNCSVTGCPWPGRHVSQGDDGRTYKTCHKHHPGVDHGRRITQADIDTVHAEHVARMTS